ncbi:MAG: polysaccharide biosynthesis C-terminal domain-containing protein [Thermoplasmata archaeon]
MEGTSPATKAPPSSAAIPRAVHSLTLSSGAVFAASLAVQLIGLIGSIFLAKQIGINTAGQALLGTAQLFLLIGSSINGVGDLRLGTAYTYYLARGKPVTDNTSVYLVVRMMMVAAAGLVLFVLAPISVFGASPFASGSGELTSLGIFLTLPILWSFSTVYNQMFIGLGNSLKAQYPGLVEALARLPILIYVSYHYHSVLAITIAYAVGAAASALFSLPAILPRLRAIRWMEALRLFRFAWPLMGSLMLNYFVTNMIPLIISAAPGLGRAQLSIFLAANGWRILVLSLPAAVTTPLFPYLAGLHQREEYHEVRRGTWQALRYSAMLLVPGVVGLVTYRYNFLNVFQNRAYAGPGALPLAILVVSALPLALSQIIQSSINAIGRQRLELYITSTSVGVMFLAVLLLMPPWGIFPIYPGIVAGAVAVLISSVAALALNTYFMETLIRVHIRPWPIVAITASAAGSFASLWLLNHLQLFPVSTWYQLLSAVVIGFVVYFAILAAIGELTRNDVRRICSSVGVPRGLYETVARLCWKESAPDLEPIDHRLAPGLRSTELPETFSGTREMPEIGPLPPEEPPEPPEEPRE